MFKPGGNSDGNSVTGIGPNVWNTNVECACATSAGSTSFADDDFKFSTEAILDEKNPVCEFVVTGANTNLPSANALVTNCVTGAQPDAAL